MTDGLSDGCPSKRSSLACRDHHDLDRPNGFQAVLRHECALESRHARPRIGELGHLRLQLRGGSRPMEIKTRERRACLRGSGAEADDPGPVAALAVDKLL